MYSPLLFPNSDDSHNNYQLIVSIPEICWLKLQWNGCKMTEPPAYKAMGENIMKYEMTCEIMNEDMAEGHQVLQISPNLSDLIGKFVKLSLSKTRFSFNFL